MAHACPECGMHCHCQGDIDDINFGDDCKAAMRCICCQFPDEVGDDLEDEDYADGY